MQTASVFSKQNFLDSKDISCKDCKSFIRQHMKTKSLFHRCKGCQMEMLINDDRVVYFDKY